MVSPMPWGMANVLPCVPPCRRAVQPVLRPLAGDCLPLGDSRALRGDVLHATAGGRGAAAAVDVWSRSKQGRSWGRRQRQRGCLMACGPPLRGRQRLA